jgi:hypothetical protein
VVRSKSLNLSKPISRCRPQAGVQQWPVKDGLIRRVAVEQRTELPIEHCPNCGARELKIIATILERLVIEKILTHLRLDPKPPPIGRKREAQARETDRRKPVG